MDSGRPDIDRPGYIKYSSEVRDTSQQTMDRFSERVQAWATANNVVLGEGQTVILPRGGHEGVVLFTMAPVIEGDGNSVGYMSYFPDDETCINAPLGLGNE